MEGVAPGEGAALTTAALSEATPKTAAPTKSGQQQTEAAPATGGSAKTTSTTAPTATPATVTTASDKASTTAKAAAANAAETAQPSTPDAESAGDAQRLEKVREAETTMRFSELLASSRYQDFITTTEVSSMSGLRWMDISASPAFFKDPVMMRLPEGQFVYSVMRALFGARFPLGVYAGAASGTALPVTYVDDNWACLILRSTKEALRQRDGIVGLLNSLHGRGEAKRLLDALPSLSKMDGGPGGALEHGGDDDAAHGEDPDAFYPRRQYAIARWARRTAQRLRRRATALRTRPTSHTRGMTGTAARRRFQRGSRKSSHRAPLTMADFTDRLTVFVGKELHPIEEDPDAPDAAAVAAEVKAAPVLSLHMNRVYSFEPFANTSAAAAGSDGAKEADEAKKKRRYEVRWRVITVHRSPIMFIRDMQAQWNRLASSNGRQPHLLRTDPVQVSVAFPGLSDPREAYASRAAQSTGASVGGAFATDDSEDGYQDAYRATVDRVDTWEDLVRLLYHGAARTLQESAYRNTRRLEGMETAIFDTTDSSATHLRSMAKLMAELHLLSRKATIHNAILRESKVAFRKLKRVMDSPMTLADNRELLYVDSVLSISAHIEEQSESLLFLQFSAAMNQTESHLRTLTVFSTFFIPLDFIASVCGTNITSLHEYGQSSLAMWAAFACMVATAVVTQRWITRNIS